MGIGAATRNLFLMSRVASLRTLQPRLLHRFPSAAPQRAPEIIRIFGLESPSSHSDRSSPKQIIFILQGKSPNLGQSCPRSSGLCLYSSRTHEKDARLHWEQYWELFANRRTYSSENRQLVVRSFCECMKDDSFFVDVTECHQSRCHFQMTKSEDLVCVWATFLW